MFPIKQQNHQELKQQREQFYKLWSFYRAKKKPFSTQLLDASSVLNIFKHKHKENNIFNLRVQN